MSIVAWIGVAMYILSGTGATNEVYEGIKCRPNSTNKRAIKITKNLHFYYTAMCYVADRSLFEPGGEPDVYLRDNQELSQLHNWPFFPGQVDERLWRQVAPTR